MTGRKSSQAASQAENSQRTRGEKSQIRNHSQDDNDNENESSKNLSGKEFDAMVSAVIQFILRANETKNQILRSDIQKIVLFNTKHYRDILTAVKKRLHEIFGYDLYEFENGKYIVTNEIPNNNNLITLTKTEKSEKVLLFLMLSHIFMSENNCPEDSLWLFLKELGILVDEDIPHPYFGNIRRVINEVFIPRKYIDKCKGDSESNDCYIYKWGVRAQKELKLKSVLEFVAMVYNVPMETFKKQHAAVVRQNDIENQNQQNN